MVTTKRSYTIPCATVLAFWAGTMSFYAENQRHAIKWDEDREQECFTEGRNKPP